MAKQARKDVVHGEIADAGRAGMREPKQLTIAEPGHCLACLGDGTNAKILSISIYMYRKVGRGAPYAGIKGTKRISICEDCFALAVIADDRPELWRSIKEKLCGLYKQTLQVSTK
jgi:hypothetical protein